MGNAGRLAGLHAVTVPIGERTAVEQIGHAVGNKSAAIVTVIDDQRLFVMIGVHAAVKFTVAVLGRIGHINVTDASARKLVHHRPAFFHPVEMPELNLAFDGFDG